MTDGQSEALEENPLPDPERCEWCGEFWCICRDLEET
jgi:hypothetical protein